MDTLVGRQLGKYRIETLLGRGGMAAVYRAQDTVLNRAVAIKVLEPALAVDPRAVERFRREAVTAANLEHPSIVRVFDVQQAGTLHYIAMRYVQGTTLRDILRENGPLPLAAIINIIKPVASALHYAHQHGVIHRDVKPGNILVEPDGSVLLTDFGIARAADNSQAALTATGQVMGTADYLAPEQISGRPAGPRSDVYSLGVILYEMLTGVTPFAGETTASILYRQVHDNPVPLRSVNPRLPVELQPVVDRALAKNPALRHSDPLDLANELQDVARRLPSGSPWLVAGGPQPMPSAPARYQRPGDGRQDPLGVYQKPIERPPSPTSTDEYMEPLPYIAEEDRYEAPRREVLAPPQPQGQRASFGLFLGILLLLAGGVFLAMAAGIIPGFGQRPARARFEPYHEVPYSGQLHKGNGPDIHVPKALVPLTIDGNLSDWQGAPSFPAPYVTLNRTRWKGDQDLSASFYFAWDAANFYVGATITDDVHVQLPSTRGYQLYKGDDVEFWFDLNLQGDFATHEANADDVQLGLSPGDFKTLKPEAVFWNPDTYKTQQRNQTVQVAARPRPGTEGYTLEAVVPWATLGSFRPKPGEAIGFAASAGDNDRQDTPVQELMVSTAPSLQYRAPFTFGNMFF